MTLSKSSFTIDKWDEQETSQWNAGKLLRAVVTKTFDGDLVGTSRVEAVMLRLQGEQDGVMAYVGVEHISCTLGGRQGGFVLVHDAESVHGEDRATWRILPGSGTGQLEGITGSGDISREHVFTLDYQLPES